MRRSGKRAEIDLDSRPKTSAAGIARLIGADRQSVYRRIREGTLNLDNIPRKITTSGTLYDLESIVMRYFPSADGNMVATIMLNFMQENGGLVR